MTIEHQQLPKVELRPGYVIPRLIRGTWQLHEAAKNLNRESAGRELLEAFDLGFTAIEAADTYHGVEELLGLLRAEIHCTRGDAAARQLRAHTRVSQLGTEPLAPAQVRASIDRSCQRLGQERLDLVQLQWWNLDLSGWIEAGLELAKLQREGRIEAVGLTNFPTGQMLALLDAGVPIVSNQVQMSLLDPRAQRTLRATCAMRGIHLLGYGPLAGGFLSGAWLGQPEPGLQPTAERPFGTVYRLLIDRFGGWDWLQELLQVLARRGAAHGTDLSSMALAWTLNRSGASALLVGIGSTRRAMAYRQVMQIAIDADDEAEIGAMLHKRKPVDGDVADIERAQFMATIAAEYANPQRTEI